MLGNILLVGFVIFSLFQFSAGITLGIQKPILLFASVLSIFLFYLLLNLGDGKILSGVTVSKNSLVGKIRKNLAVKVFSVILLWILAVGNFAYAHNWIGTPIVKGAEYLEAAVLSFISFVILSNKVKTS